MIIDGLKAKGTLDIIVRGPDGNIRDEKKVENLIVDTGLDYIASRMTGTSENVMSHMAVGTGSTAAAAADTALGTELDRNALTSTTVTSNAIAYVCSWAARDGTGSLTEAGLFNDSASGSGTMLCRTVFGTVTKGASDSMTITWTITVSAS